MISFFVVKKGYASHLTDELTLYPRISITTQGDDWLCVDGPSSLSQQSFCFATAALFSPCIMEESALNNQVTQLLQMYFKTIENKKLHQAFPIHFFAAEEQEGLSQRVRRVEELWFKSLAKMMPRVSRLAKPTEILHGLHRGVFVYFTDFQKAYLSTEAWFGGQRRMKFDDEAPSRSYLKVEEAYSILGVEPQASERVADLGAAPGGWSYSAAKRKASVFAVDNGPLKSGALKNPYIKHIREDAFKFQPSGKVDWLFCDVVETPTKVLALISQWVERKQCRYVIVNFKIGRANAKQVLEQINASSLARLKTLIIRQLYHDRDEMTVMGKL